MRPQGFRIIEPARQFYSRQFVSDRSWIKVGDDPIALNTGVRSAKGPPIIDQLPYVEAFVPLPLGDLHGA